MSAVFPPEPPVPPADGATPEYLDALLSRLAAAGDDDVVIHASGPVTGAQLCHSIYRYARALHLLGIGRGDLVALWAPNEPAALAVRYAAHVTGAATMYLPDASPGAQRTALLDVIDPQLVVVFEATAGLLPPGTRRPVVSIGVDVPDALRLDVLAEVQEDGPLPVAAHSDDLAVIVSSGGSTGVPKGSCRTFTRYGRMVDVGSPADRRQLVNGELAHLSQALVDQTLLGGGTVVLIGSCAPAATLAAIEDHAVTDVFLVEPQLADLIDDPSLTRHDLSSLRSVLHIGASAPATLRRRARRVLGPIITHTYGASETGIVSRLAPGDHDLERPSTFTSAGRTLPGVEIRFRGSEGQLVDPGRPGTIEVRAAAAATSYRNHPTATATTFLLDGWVHTGDVGCVDAHGELHVLGRVADIVEVDGHLVTPSEVEDTLMGTADVRIASVLADLRHRRWVAAVVPWPGSTIDVDECLRAIEHQHGSAVAAMMVVVPIDHLPLTGQGKPARQRITRLPERRRPPQPARTDGV